MPKTMRIEKLHARYQRLARQLAPCGWIIQGSAIERAYPRTVSGEIKHYGPYYSWTRKVDNKTVTVALSKKQYRLMQQAIARHRKIEQTLTLMRAISEQIILLATDGVSRRSR